LKFGIGNRSGHVLSWENRMQIAMEAAQGDEITKRLAYILIFDE